MLCHTVERHLGNTGCHKQVNAKGRGDHAKRNADDHNNTQRNGTYIKGAHHRHQDWCQYDHGRVDGHKAANDGQQNDQCNQNTSSAASRTCLTDKNTMNHENPE